MDRYWKARCEECGWSGSSKKLLGGEPLADTGDYNDLFCPRCDSCNVDGIEYFPKMKFIWIWRTITFYGARKKFIIDYKERLYYRKLEKRYKDEIEEQRRSAHADN